jgi:hypothetical protein
MKERSRSCLLSLKHNTGCGSRKSVGMRAVRLLDASLCWPLFREEIESHTDSNGRLSSAITTGRHELMGKVKYRHSEQYLVLPFFFNS